MRETNTWMRAVVVGSIALLGCSGDETGQQSAVSGDAGRDGGAIDAGPDSGGGRTGADLASAGTVSKSPNFTLVGTLGQSSGGNGTSKSTSYQIRGGIVGATQKP